MRSVFEQGENLLETHKANLAMSIDLHLRARLQEAMQPSLDRIQKKLTKLNELHAFSQNAQQLLQETSLVASGIANSELGESQSEDVAIDGHSASTAQSPVTANENQACTKLTAPSPVTA